MRRRNQATKEAKAAENAKKDESKELDDDKPVATANKSTPWYVWVGYVSVPLMILFSNYMMYKQLVPTDMHSRRAPLRLISKYRSDTVGIPSFGRVHREIDEKSWALLEVDADDLSVPTLLSQYRLPVIVRGSPAKDWAAIQKWNTSSPDGLNYLLKKVPVLHKVRKAVHPVFVYEDFNRMLGKDPRFQETVGKPVQEHIDISTKEFLGLASRRDRSLKGDFSLYYSHELNHTAAFAAVDKDASPRDWLSVNEVEMDSSSSSRTDCEAATGRPMANCATVWMGKSQISAGSHYDPGHNIFVQVSGRKRFVLTNPNEHKDMNVYPFYHPRDRQSQREVGASEVRYVGAQRIKALDKQNGGKVADTDDRVPYFVGDLGPGDMLYLPPYWFHRVTALEPDVSVSVNLWSPSREQELSDSLTDMPNQITKDDKATPETVAAIGAFVTAVVGDFVVLKNFFKNDKELASLHTVRGNLKNVKPFVRHFIQSIVESRYMYEKNSMLGKGLSCSAFEVATCPTFGGELSEERQQDVDMASGAITNKLINFLNVHKASAARRPEITVNGVLDMIIGDWVERAVTFGLRDVAETCRFLRCLSNPEAWVSEEETKGQEAEL